MSSKSNGNEIAEPQAPSTLVEALEAPADNPVSAEKADMRAMRAEGFSGYRDLKLVDIPKPALSDGRVLVRIIAAGVTPLEHTILWGDTHEPKHRWSWEEREQA